MILITSTGESLLYFTASFSFVSFHQKKKKLLQECFSVLSWVDLFLLQDCMFQWSEL